MSKPVDKPRWHVSYLSKILSGHMTPSQALPSPPASMPPPTIPNIPNFEDYLLQPADEGTLRHSWILLDKLIEAHVEEFYQSDYTVSSVENIAEDLDEFEVVKSAERIGDLSNLIYWPQYRHLGLRICVARILLSSIDFHGFSEESSLPVEVVGLLRKFQEVHPVANAVDGVALAKWRMITAFLLSPPSRTSNKEFRKEEQFPCVKTLDDLLKPFCKKVENRSEFNANRIHSLQSLAAHTAEFGQKLFAHPSTWTFQWTTKSTPHPSRNASQDTENGVSASLEEEKDDVVLFPALLRVDTPSKAGKQKGHAVVVQPSDVGRGFISREITILEKKKNEPIPSLDSGFSVIEPREFEHLRSNTGRERVYGSRPAPVRRQSVQVEPRYASVIEADYRERVEKMHTESSRSHYSVPEYGAHNVEQPVYTESPEESEQSSGRRRTRRKKNRSQSARN